MNATDYTAYEMGKESRLTGRPLLDNPFHRTAWGTVAKKLGHFASPDPREWVRWHTLWDKGWKDVDEHLRFGLAEEE